MDKLLFNFRKWLFKQKRNLNSFVLYISVGVLLITLALIYNTVYKPLTLKYEEQVNTIYSYNANISMLPELSLTSEIMNTKLNGIKDVYQKLNDIVPDKRNVPFVTSQISLAAEGNSVRIESMSKILETNITLGEDVFGVVKYNIICFSEYDDIVNFLSTLETSNSVFAIEKVEISPLSEEDFKKYQDISLVKTNLDINIYMKSK